MLRRLLQWSEILLKDVEPLCVYDMMSYHSTKNAWNSRIQFEYIVVEFVTSVDRVYQRSYSINLQETSDAVLNAVLIGFLVD